MRKAAITAFALSEYVSDDDRRGQEENLRLTCAAHLRRIRENANKIISSPTTTVLLAAIYSAPLSKAVVSATTVLRPVEPTSEAASGSAPISIQALLGLPTWMTMQWI